MSIEAGRENHSVRRAAGRTAAAGQPMRADTGVGGRTAVLQAVDLTLSFGQRTILSDINVDVRRGAVTALIGPTGLGEDAPCCGRSTG